MTINMPHVAARIFDVPLMIDERKAAAIIAGIGGRMVEGGFIFDGVEVLNHAAFEQGRPSMGRLGNPLGRAYEEAGVADRMLWKADGVAVIPIEGTLVHKGKWLGASSGETSYEGIQARVMRARADPSVKGVIFEVDSFGGEVAGAFDTAQMIHELSAEKPTLAILTEFAMSAGYLMAAAARQIVLPETGAAGSIGVITMHADFSKKIENQGVKITLISSGAKKADGHPALPLSESHLAEVQASVDRTRDLFATAVGNFRGSRLTKADALATEAGRYSGALAVDAGLADGVIRPSEAFDAFIKDVNRASRLF